jgi:alpha-tubulin suppressor-like RCC1 family protein
MVRFRKRFVSGSSYKEMRSSSFSDADETMSREQKLKTTVRLFRTYLQQHRSKACLSTLNKNPALLAALLDRTQHLDELLSTNGESNASTPRNSLRQELCLATDKESGYTALHWAVYRGDLASLLLLLRHALSNASPRLTQRPMAMLENAKVASIPLVEAMVTAKDREGFTAADLLAHRQVKELLACRLSLPRPRVSTRGGDDRRRRSSFGAEDQEVDEQNEFDLLSKYLQMMQRHSRQANSQQKGSTEYGCEVLTFGQAHHCALGVGNPPDSSKVRPQRVQAFGQSQTGRVSGAVAIAAAAHHTLVATASGELYAFGLGKGGRLGLGDQVTHCPTPVRVTATLAQRRVVGIAAAENHSIAVTACGYVFTWGSNRFGQLSEDGASRSTPRRVEDLKSSFCVSVAAGAKHSVALSRQGEIYVWGDNTAGQLGISRRNGTHKVQRIESLWNASPPKVAISVAASVQATLVLTIPTGSGLPVNSVYSWGHGSHVPSRVFFGAQDSNRPVNPIDIACARYHNVAVSADGLVYTWGLHAEALGVKTKKFSTSQSSMFASPQVVKGMLPENGGGLAVAVSASDNHTVVLTDTGSLYTWGATNDKNVMGHAGVRWQPDPKRVPGVSRAVAVAAAKEHTVFLMGASFPPLPVLPELMNSLEELAARKIADFIDLFNAIPLLMVAERANAETLTEYCYEFCRLNLDGVLAVAQRSLLDAFLSEQLSGSTLEVNDLERDQLYHPLLEDLIFAGSQRGPLNTVRVLCEKEDWLTACEQLSRSEKLHILADRAFRRQASFTYDRQRSRSLSTVTGYTRAVDSQKPTCSDRCMELTANMDLSTKELAEQKLALIMKELRGVKKRLNQIAKLENSNDLILSAEQREKIARRPCLDLDLEAFESGLAKAEKKLKLYAKDEEMNSDKHTKTPVETGGIEAQPASLRCNVCGITCPDERSHTMHMNGRKHRNRVVQAKEAEQKKTAAAVMTEHHRHKLLNMQSQEIQKVYKPAWTKGKKMAAQPTYKLPPPPHGTPDSIVPSSPRPSTAKPTLKDIMTEERRKNAAAPKKKASVVRRPIKSLVPALSLPAGSAAPLKSPPWAVAPLTLSPWASPGSTESPSPALVSSPPITVGKPSASNSSFSLADYVKKPATASALSSSPKPGGSWKRPNRATATPTNAVRFSEIQQQELTSKEIEDPAFQTPKGESNKWFFERRARSGSLLEIQGEANKERESRLVIEEQFRIERIIAEENAARKQQPGRKQNKSQSKKKQSSKSSKKSSQDKKSMPRPQP